MNQPQTITKADLRKFVDEFGPTGAELLLAGKTFDEAKAYHTKSVSDENAQLKAANEELRDRLDMCRKLMADQFDWDRIEGEPPGV